MNGMLLTEKKRFLLDFNSSHIYILTVKSPLKLMPCNWSPDAQSMPFN